MSATLDYSQPWFTNPELVRENVDNYILVTPAGQAKFLDDKGDFNKPGFKVLESKDETTAGIRAAFTGCTGFYGSFELHWQPKEKNWSGGCQIKDDSRDEGKNDQKFTMVATFADDGSAKILWSAGTAKEEFPLIKKA